MKHTTTAAFHPKAGTYRRLWKLIPKAQQRRSPLLLLSLFIGTAFEVVGIALLVPLVNLLVNDSVSSEDSVLGPVF